MDFRKGLKGLFLAAPLALVGACGDGAEEQSSEYAQREAEAPYGAPGDHANATTQATQQAERANPLKAQPAATSGDEMIAASPGAVENKVGNVTAKAASAGDQALKSAALNASDTKQGAEGGLGGLSGDANRGKRLFGQCAVCHSVKPGENRIGPTLHGIVGREAGAIEDYNYSEANASADFVWTEDALFAYLDNPMEYMPGTKMSFAGVRDEQNRADIVAYLATLTP